MIQASQYKTGGHVGGAWGVIVAVVVVLVLIALVVLIGRRGMDFWKR